MRALIIQHDHVSPAGPVGERLAARGYELVFHEVVPQEQFHTPNVETEFPEAASCEVIVPMGAPWSTFDHALIGSWVTPELELLRQADAHGVPVLGICFGGQLLAAAHGGSVAASPSPEVGYVEVSSDDEDLVASGEWFEWHGDRWQVPPLAREIARNDAASQAFVLRRNLAVQFHPELTPAMLAGWLDNGGDRKAISLGVDPDQLRAQAASRVASAQRRAFALVDAFLDRVATSGQG